MTQAVFSAFDYQMMTQAIALAKQGIYTTAPNPNVGCVITKDQAVIGQGAHLKAGQPHAEVHALRQAAEQATGATAYVTLEPCSHYGRTPPCAEALIKAQVARVVCAMQDPNPQVAGRGIQMLREAGIQVDVGLLEQDAINLNPGFIKRMKTGMPFVQLKLAASLDGKTALANGDSQWITGPKARQDVQAYRAKAGAILSTAKTVIDDNASLNVRWQDLPESIQSVYQQDSLRQPVRVVLDRQAKLQNPEYTDLKLWQQQGEILTLHDLAIEVPDPFKSSHQSRAAKVVEQQFDLPSVLKQLADEHNINHIWVEAGAQLAASFIEQNCVDELIIYLAPRLMGTDGRGLTQLCGLSSMNDLIELDIQDVRMVDSDIRLTATIKKK
ncbi:bifunctional diaminohydroxyphosphoribosylaminopyrimidine deaminase/5-amino-6-(5-phosphoribosylamino)uracil reductase RibD [Vibrio algivorus]|uniref:Riboflavin biosynthesis protein RibD n=1 Tax=Vibrio algivorus TaxID=1667024 RepID=A0A557P2D2_9VIBR|nr:bifunctional diaminohydroxyphosphoribosylaminopyrimidine deaminase/5-amino-6-(5-phosphoribosylamino)uracil reductase RibD [Vibrio algivorus]TVO34828.1 bifunctional diaminohydroxyphosphoribosylaminopyrimidine deaminase/5-amino-6-(5-phosphoribosylamino)uracil reductase RibD [Vibrio algivorus]